MKPHEMMSSPEKMNGAELSKTLSSLSPAERANMLKSRFAGLIAKANDNNPHEQQTKVILKINSLSEESNSTKRKRRETPQDDEQQEEEKEEEIEVKKRREDDEEGELITVRKKQEIEEERKAFRLKLEKLERSVEVVDNYKVTRDFEKLINAKPKPYS